MHEAEAPMVLAQALGPSESCARVAVGGHMHHPLGRAISRFSCGKGANPLSCCHAVYAHPLLSDVAHRPALDRPPLRKAEGPLGGINWA